MARTTESRPLILRSSRLNAFNTVAEYRGYFFLISLQEKLGEGSVLDILVQSSVRCNMHLEEMILRKVPLGKTRSLLKIYRRFREITAHL